MKFTRTAFIATASLLTALLLTPDHMLATNGYFLHGIGAKSKGMAGAGVALPQGTLDAALNPALLPFIRNTGNVGLALFSPDRKYTVTGDPTGDPYFGLTPGTISSGSRLFPIPHLGYARQLQNGGAFGVALYGQGGMNTDYDTNTFYGTAPTGVDLSQMFIGLTYAQKLGDKNALSLTPTLVYQRFAAKGLQAFSEMSEDAAALTNNGHANSMGIGLRFGYTGQWHEAFSVGASFATKMFMSEFEDYAGLFAEQGDFDIPANWTVGFAVTPNEKFAFAFDVQQILYEGIKSVSNPMNPAGTFNQGILLGNKNGAGFGWQNMTVAKFGVQVMPSPVYAVRAGFSAGNQPIPDSEVMFNILAPGVITRHLTFGATRTLPNSHDIDLAVSFALTDKVAGPNPMESPGAQVIELEMNQIDVEIGYAF